MIRVRQLVACLFQLNFNGEIKCLRIIKRLNLDILESEDQKFSEIQDTSKVLRITGILVIKSLRLSQLGSS